MKAQIVVDLGFGDGGKGVTTDFLCSQNSPSDTIVIRFSGGQQAGHTVIHNGVKHIHATYGSGTLRDFPTYISKYCTFYPPNMLNEAQVLVEKKADPSNIFFHPLAMLTTPYDVAYNRLREKVLRHGSCGMGVGATMKRNAETPYRLYAADLTHSRMLEEKLKGIQQYYNDLISSSIFGKAAGTTTYKQIVAEEEKRFEEAVDRMTFNLVSYSWLSLFDNFIFEGSQGIMLDMDHGIFPNVTYGHTTSRNAIEICKDLNIKDIEMYYVTRCYQTRHSNGWMSSTAPVSLINNEEEINTDNEWQQKFKVSELDYSLLSYALECDNSYSWMAKKNLVVTCLDQRPSFNFDFLKLPYTMGKVYGNYSPHSNNFKKIEYVRHKTKAVNQQ